MNSDILLTWVAQSSICAGGKHNNKSRFCGFGSDSTTLARAGTSVNSSALVTARAQSPTFAGGDTVNSETSSIPCAQAPEEGKAMNHDAFVIFKPTKPNLIWVMPGNAINSETLLRRRKALIRCWGNVRSNMLLVNAVGERYAEILPGESVVCLLYTSPSPRDS